MVTDDGDWLGRLRRLRTSKGPGVGLTAPGPALPGGCLGGPRERQQAIARGAVSFPMFN